ncbi:MAG: phosphatidylserine decarboxylase [Sphingomonadaceae bacterium]|nr:phosphatidylserine decarboxylase [Sphingomonadaceae bacterium]
MTVRSALSKIVMQEDLNFLLTNRLPRRAATRFVGWFSKIENPLVAKASIATWRLFSDVDLTDARETRWRSMHACFTRALRDGARAFDPDPAILASPSDAIVGACGQIERDRLYQVKGFPYRLDELIGDAADDRTYSDGTFATLRLTAGMYHRFHAPHDIIVTQVDYRSGDCWNVNPIALKRVEKLFCRNERATIATRLDVGGWPVLLVPVAAILVASIRLTFLDTEKTLRDGPRRVPLDHHLAKGTEMGWFEHGSTIIVIAPPGFALAEGIAEGVRIRAGEALMRLPDSEHLGSPGTR